MDVGSSFVANSQAPEPMQPAQRSVDHPAPAAQALTAFDAAPRDAHADAATVQPPAVAWVVVALVGVQLVWPLARPATQAGARWQRPNQRLQHPRVMDIGPREPGHQRRTALIDDDVVLATELSPVRGIGAGVIAPQGGKARWPSRCWRVTTRSDRTGVTCAMPPHAGAATRQRVANHAGAASRSCRCRSPSRGASTPRGCRCAANTRFPSRSLDRSNAAVRPEARVYEGAARARSGPTTRRPGLAWP